MTDGEALTSVNVQRSLPLGPGFGFRIDADAQEPYRSTGIFEVQGKRGILGVRADGSQEDKTVGTINLAGSIVGIGGELLLSRPVDDAFRAREGAELTGGARAREQPTVRTHGTTRLAVRARFAVVPVEPDRDRAG